MTINEFISVLQSSLENEIPASEIKNNINYYQEYMKSQQSLKSEEEITEALGDPRLIARTIINTYQINHGGQKYYNNNQAEDNNQTEGNYKSAANNQYGKTGYGGANESEHYNNRFKSKKGSRISFFQLPGWLITLIVVLFFIIIMSTIFWLGGLVLKLIIRFAIPILVIWVGISLIRRINK